jgi:hypothetical protein
VTNTIPRLQVISLMQGEDADDLGVAFYNGPSIDPVGVAGGRRTGHFGPHIGKRRQFQNWRV